MNFSTVNDTDKNNDNLSGYAQDLEHIRNVPLLQSLDYDCQKLLAMVCRRVTFRAGDTLAVAGEKAECAYYLLTGKAQATLVHDSDTHQIRSYGQGDFIGSCSLLGKGVHIFTITAEVETITLRLGRNDFHKVMDQFSGAMSRVCEQLVDRIIRWDESLLERSDSGNLKNTIRNVGVSLL